MGSGTATATVNLTGVANAQIITVTLAGVNNGSATGDVSVQMGVLLGDTSGNGSVTGTDVIQTKVQAGQAVTSSNFRNDVVPNGSLSGTDVTTVKASTGHGLAAVRPNERCRRLFGGTCRGIAVLGKAAARLSGFCCA